MLPGLVVEVEGVAGVWAEGVVGVWVDGEVALSLEAVRFVVLSHPSILKPTITAHSADFVMIVFPFSYVASRDKRN